MAAAAGGTFSYGYGAGQLDPLTGKPRQPTPQQQAVQASHTNPTNASLPQNQGINLPTLPPPKNLQMTSATLGPNGYEASYGAAPRDPVADYAAQAKIDADNAAASDARRSSTRAAALSGFQDSLKSFTDAPIDVGGPSAADLDAADRAAYTHARETIGQQKLAALAAFRDQLAGSGMMGSTLESAGVGDVISGAEHELGDVVMNQAQNRVSRLDTAAATRAQMLEQRRQAALSALSSAFTSGGGLY